MKEIRTTNEKTIVVDDEVYEEAMKYKWYARKSYGRMKGRIITYIKEENKKYRRVRFTDLILHITSPKICYHKNGNTLDLRKENLIVCNNRSEASHYSGGSPSSNGQYRNVYLKKRYNTWQSSVRINGKTVSNGTYDLEEEAAYFSDFLILTHIGTDAIRNFPDMDLSEITRKCDEITEIYKKKRVDKRSKCFQGQKNSKRDCPPSSKYMGVSCRTNGVHFNWSANIVQNNKSYSLGGYTKEEDAAIAYDIKAIEIYGSDAKRNFPYLTINELKKKMKHIKENNKILRSETSMIKNQGVRRKQKKTSQYVGVSYDKNRRKWVSNITYNKKVYRLGRFDDEKEAALAYDKKAIELYGEFCNLNFPEQQSDSSEELPPGIK